MRFQVLAAASMKFRIVFWDVLPCKIIVDLTRQYIPEDNSELKTGNILYILAHGRGRAKVETVRRRAFTSKTRFEPESVHVVLGMDKVALGQVFPEFLGIILSTLFHRGSPYPYVT
jgi:hypothetical protein